MEKVWAEGLSPPAALREAAPMPRPRRFRSSCTTRATTTPASTAPQEILLSMMERASSVGVTGLTCGASSSPRLRGVSGVPGVTVTVMVFLPGAAPDVLAGQKSLDVGKVPPINIPG